MYEETAQRPLAHLTMAELKIVDRLAARYAKYVTERAELVGMASLAIRRGDWELMARTKLELDQITKECNECYVALQVLRHELGVASPAGECDGDALVTV